MLKVHKVVDYKTGPKGKRVDMVQASFTDKTGHHTNHMSLSQWQDKLAASKDVEAENGLVIAGSVDLEPEEELVGYPGDNSGVGEEADVSNLRTDFEAAY